MNPQLAPQKIISLGTLTALAIVLFCIEIATSTPWLGVTFSTDTSEGLIVENVANDGPASETISPGDRLVAINDVTLQRQDIMEEPDEFPFYRNYNHFLERQQLLTEALKQQTVTLYFHDGASVALTPAPSRPLSSISWLFWYQLACGSIVFLAGIGVLAFRPWRVETRYYALTGFGLLLAASSAAIYSTRELALGGELFYTLSLTNQFGTLLFSGTFVSILWYYPDRIHRFPMGPVLISANLCCWFLNLFQVSESIDMTMRYPLFAGLLINLLLALVQWRRSRNNPIQRAILKWFLLAWLSGTTLYLGIYTLPLVMHIEVVLNQSLGWGILLTIYLGIALGITRYSLFNLDRWVITGWFWFLGGVMVIGLDAVLVSLLHLDDRLALATTLAVAGWLYFPARQYLWQRLSRHYRKRVDYRELLPSLLGTMLNTRPHQLQAEWRQLLQRIFAPLHLEPVEAVSVKVHSEGIALTVPGFQNIHGLKLSYADHGERLFNVSDLQLANAIHQLFCRIHEYRDAFDQGVQVERQRVARDLHDDVGAKLLSLVYSANDEQQAELARETLQELRSVIQNLEHQHYSLSATLAELRMETHRRCEVHHVRLVWNQSGDVDEYPLEARQHTNLQRIIREAVSNALRHADPSMLQLDLSQQQGRLSLKISNNTQHPGAIVPPKEGRGMRNIRARSEELGGHAEWCLGSESQLGSYTIQIEIPLEDEKQ